ncbi:MAG: VIT domain-containing protein [Pirellulaceae bacterium]
MKRFTLWALVVALTLPTWCATQALGQGFLLVEESGRRVAHPLPRPFIVRPTPPVTSYKVKSIEMNAKVVDQTAQVQLTQTFVNTGSRQMQVTFVFPLPADAVVDEMTFMVDNKEYEAKIMPAAQARSIFEGYVRRNKDPALLEWAGLGMVKTSVFPVPPGAERKVILQYSQILRRNDRLTELTFPLSTAKFTSQPIENLSVRVSVESRSKIKNIYSPSHSVNIERRDNKHAVIKLSAQNVIPTSDFQLFFDVSKKDIGASLIAYRPQAGEDGYFLLMASPDIGGEVAEAARKTIVFVVDRSGSMSGKKIEQAREALKFVLNNLNEGDLFNIVAYDSSVEAFREELQRYNDQTRGEALAFVDGIYSGGSTNIDGALTVALGMLQNEKLPNYVIFLTDGRPTAGEKNEMKIAANAAKNNKVDARILNMGVGYDVNSRLLDRIAVQNFGISQYVRPNQNLEEHVSKLYGRISRPVLTNVKLSIDVEDHDGNVINRVYPRRIGDLFAGEQLVIAGRYKPSGDAKVVIKGRIGDEKRSFDFPGKLVKASRGENYAFVEKLWATRRIGEIIDELDLNGQNEELMEELVGLSVKHGILTPYTSFLADENSAQGIVSRGRILDETRRQLNRLSSADGRAGLSQRAAKQAFKTANAAPGGGGTAGLGGGGFGDFGAAAEATAKDASIISGLAKRGVQGAQVFEGDDGVMRVTDKVLQIGKETLYKRGKLWVTASTRTVDLKKDRAKIIEIERFSKSYFDLTKENSKSENAVFAQQAQDEELLISIRGKIYLIK